MVSARRLAAVAVVVAALALASAVAPAEAKKDPKDCEVCIRVVAGIKEVVGDDYKSTEKVEAAIDKYCKKKDIGAKEKKACYYLIDIKRDAAKPITMGAPDDRVCKKLGKRNSEICDLRFPIKVEKGTTDYSKMRIKELKRILSDRGVTCEGCLEKPEFVKKCLETEDLQGEL